MGEIDADRRKTVTRVELSEAIYRTKAGLTRAESAALVDSVLKEIADAIARDEMVKLSSFGTFRVRMKTPRIGRNPKTGVEVPITPRRVLQAFGDNEAENPELHQTELAERGDGIDPTGGYS
jgi:integration host factor subunit alpha